MAPAARRGLRIHPASLVPLGQHDSDLVKFIAGPVAPAIIRASLVCLCSPARLCGRTDPPPTAEHAVSNTLSLLGEREGEEPAPTAAGFGRAACSTFRAPGRLTTRPLFPTRGLPRLGPWIEAIVQQSGAATATLMVALVFVERVHRSLPANATRLNSVCHRVLLAAVVVAAKMTHDRALKNAVWARYSVIFVTHDINLMEVQLLKLLDYDLIVTEPQLMAICAPLIFGPESDKAKAAAAGSLPMRRTASASALSGEVAVAGQQPPAPVPHGPSQPHRALSESDLGRKAARDAAVARSRVLVRRQLQDSVAINEEPICSTKPVATGDTARGHQHCTPPGPPPSEDPAIGAVAGSDFASFRHDPSSTLPSTRSSRVTRVSVESGTTSKRPPPPLSPLSPTPSFWDFYSPSTEHCSAASADCGPALPDQDADHSRASASFLSLEEESPATQTKVHTPATPLKNLHRPQQPQTDLSGGEYAPGPEHTQVISELETQSAGGLEVEEIQSLQAQPFSELELTLKHGHGRRDETGLRDGQLRWSPTLYRPPKDSSVSLQSHGSEETVASSLGVPMTGRRIELGPARAIVPATQLTLLERKASLPKAPSLSRATEATKSEQNPPDNDTTLPPAARKRHERQAGPQLKTSKSMPHMLRAPPSPVASQGRQCATRPWMTPRVPTRRRPPPLLPSSHSQTQPGAKPPCSAPARVKVFPAPPATAITAAASSTPMTPPPPPGRGRSLRAKASALGLRTAARLRSFVGVSTHHTAAG